MEFDVYNVTGEVVDRVQVSDYIFAAPINIPVMHQALMRQQANARLGTHQTKTRGDVRGGGAKPWRQKGTGRARQGTRRAPHWRGGGVVFGPHPRSYEQKMPKRMRRLALRSALSVKARDKQIVLVDALPLEQSRTKDMLAILGQLPVGNSVLIALPETDELVERSARNITGVKTLRVNYLNIRDLLKYDTLLMPVGALSVIHDLWDAVAAPAVEDEA
ncbi:MAG: 50S ribosomal protein L4 [Chloroflexi bacterium]|nr:50S ribosomal protein L4 [Chloroflexota bacterium]MBU1750918.1 50S ribosomal protein L4 [Chloroflexota bacterium]MBU1878178.1 50S ribosomal protein L4 [Chloroflexota bacterium]